MIIINKTYSGGETKRISIAGYMWDKISEVFGEVAMQIQNKKRKIKINIHDDYYVVGNYFNGARFLEFIVLVTTTSL